MFISFPPQYLRQTIFQAQLQVLLRQGRIQTALQAQKMPATSTANRAARKAKPVRQGRELKLWQTKCTSCRSRIFGKHDNRSGNNAYNAAANHIKRPKPAHNGIAYNIGNAERHN